MGSAQRERERLQGDTLDDEILVRAYRTGEYVDQFTTTRATPEEIQATLDRLPKCMQKRES